MVTWPRLKEKENNHIHTQNNKAKDYATPKEIERRTHKREEMNLDFMVFEKRVIKSWLMRDVNTVNDIPIWTLFNHHI